MSKYPSKPRQTCPGRTCVSNPTMASMHSQNLGLWKQLESFIDSSDLAVSRVYGNAWLVFEFTGKYL